VLEIEVPQEVVKKRADEISAELRRRARLPGFRPGKAPLSLVRQRYRDDIRTELLRDLVPEYLAARTKQDHLDPVGDPSVSDIELAEDSPLKFKATLEVMPEFELKDYGDLEIEIEEPEVSDKEVEETLARMREEGATYINVEESRPIQDGDFANIALQEVPAGGGTGSGKTHDLLCEIGSERTVEEFTANLRGATLGEERTFSVAYPKGSRDNRLAGKTLTYRVKVLGIKKKQLPELNDDFARELGKFDSIEVVRQHIREDLEEAKQRDAEQKAKTLLREKLAEIHDFSVPEVLVERQIEKRMEALQRQLQSGGMDVDWARIRAMQRPEALIDVKSTLILQKIAAEELLEVEQAEVQKEIQKIAGATNQTPESVEAHLTHDGVLDRIKSRLRIEKALEFAFQHVRRKSPRLLAG